MDFLPRGFSFRSGEEARILSELTGRLENLLASSGAEPIYLPTLVGEELYSRLEKGVPLDGIFKLSDRKGRGLHLRPEGTMVYVSWLASQASVSARHFYWGPMFRYERPQAGRRREFYQFCLETSAPRANGIDEGRELALLVSFLSSLGLAFSVKANYLGFRENLSSRLQREAELRSMSPERLRAALDAGEMRLDEERWGLVLGHEEKADLLRTMRRLSLAGVRPRWDSSLHRGLHYYSRLVFEFQPVGGGPSFLGGGCYDGALRELNPRYARARHFG